MMWLSCILDLKKLSTWKLGRNHRPLMKMVSRLVTSVIDVALLYYRSEETLDMKIWTKSSPTHENGLQIAHFYEWCGSLVLQISRKSRHENLDEIIAHSWKWSPDSSLLWMMWLFCTIDLKKLSTWKFGRNHRHSWKWSPKSSLLWMMWLSCILDLKKQSTWKFGQNHRRLIKMVSR